MAVKCSVCSGEMKPLFTSFYCETCDARDGSQSKAKPEPITEFTDACGIEWKTIKLPRNSKPPYWATRFIPISASKPDDLERAHRSDLPIIAYHISAFPNMLNPAPSWAVLYGQITYWRFFGKTAS